MSIESIFLSKEKAEILAEMCEKNPELKKALGEAVVWYGKTWESIGSQFPTDLWIKIKEHKNKSGLITIWAVNMRTGEIDKSFNKTHSLKRIPTYTSDGLFAALPEWLIEWYYNLLDGTETELSYELATGANSHVDIADDLKKIIQDNKPNNLEIYYQLIVYCYENGLM